MTQIKKSLIEKDNAFQAIANVNFFLPVNMYDGVRKYNENYQQELIRVNGEGAKLPPQMGLRAITRGEVILFGDEVLIDEETGNVLIYPKEVFKELNNYKVELPCEMLGEAVSNFEKSLASLPIHMRKELEDKKNTVTARFRVVPFVEKYNGQELSD